MTFNWEAAIVEDYVKGRISLDVLIDLVYEDNDVDPAV